MAFAAEEAAAMMEGAMGEVGFGGLAAEMPAEIGDSLEIELNNIEDLSPNNVEEIDVGWKDLGEFEGESDLELGDDGFQGDGEGGVDGENGAGGNGAAGRGENAVEGAGGNGNGREPADSPAVRSKILNNAGSAAKWLALQVGSAIIMGGVMIGLTKAIAAMSAKPDASPEIKKKNAAVEKSNAAMEECKKIAQEWRKWLVDHHSKQNDYGFTKAGPTKITNYELFFRGLVDTDKFKDAVGTALLKVKLTSDGSFDDSKVGPVNIAVRNWARALLQLAKQLVEYKEMTDDRGLTGDVLNTHVEDLEAVLAAYAITPEK